MLLEYRLTIMTTLAQDESRKKKGLPLDGICQSPMVPEWRLQMMANLIFCNYLSEKDKVLALANSILEGYKENTNEDRGIEAPLETKQRELTCLQKRMDNLIEMRADGDLSREMFRMKTEELEPKMRKLQKEIEELSAKHESKVIVDYKEKLTVLQYALSQYSKISSMMIKSSGGVTFFGKASNASREKL